MLWHSNSNRNHRCWEQCWRMSCRSNQMEIESIPGQLQPGHDKWSKTVHRMIKRPCRRQAIRFLKRTCDGSASILHFQGEHIWQLLHHFNCFQWQQLSHWDCQLDHSAFKDLPGFHPMSCSQVICDHFGKEFSYSCHTIHLLRYLSRRAARENKRLQCSGIEPETTRQHDVYSCSQFFL